MSDMPKCLKATSRIRWGVFTIASLLTVTAGFLLWVEVTDGAPSSARSFVWGTALALWICGTLMSCALLVVRLVNKRIDRWGNKLLQAYAVQRLGALAEILPDNVTQLHGRK